MLTEETEVPRFYSVNQISPYIMRISDGLISNVKQYASYELDVMSLRCLEELLFLQVSLHLQVKGCREIMNVEDTKTRDIRLMQNDTVLQDSGVKECLQKMSDLSVEVLERDVITAKMSAAKLNTGIRFLLRTAVVYCVNPVSYTHLTLPTIWHV